jgi:RNA-splicing ligase RtcB
MCPRRESAYDIGCGNKAARTGLTKAGLNALGGVERIMREIMQRISFGMGVPAQERADHPVLEQIREATSPRSGN